MYLFSALHGHGTSASPSAERRADRVHARHELAVGAEHVEGALAHAGHDPHVDRDVGRVGELHADVGDGRAERAHARTAPRTWCGPSWRRGRARSARPSSRPGSRQLLVGPASISLLGADEGAVLDPGDVARVGQRRGSCSGAWPSFEPVEGAAVDQQLARGGRTPRRTRRTSGRRRAGRARPSRRPSRAASCVAGGCLHERHVVRPRRRRIGASECDRRSHRGYGVPGSWPRVPSRRSRRPAVGAVRPGRSGVPMSTSEPRRSRVARPSSSRSKTTRWPWRSMRKTEPSSASAARSYSRRSVSQTTMPSPVPGS